MEKSSLIPPTHALKHSLPQYMPQLDALRFFAVLLVLIEHWIPGIGETYLSLGPTGVTFFFVLSGYLITRILIKEKLPVPGDAPSNARIICQFYIRRFLRIFPVYYLFLFGVMLLPTVGQEVRENSWWYIFYLNNFKIYANQDWGVIAHTWSLAVEEQFYLIWPFIICFTPKRYLLKTMLLFIAIGMGSRVLYFFLIDDPTGKTVYGTILTPFCFDAFGLGALLAYQQIFNLIPPEKLEKKIPYFLGAALFIWVIIIYSAYDPVFYLTSNSVIAFISLGIISLAAKGFTGYGQKLLENPVLLYLGKISYGIYLFHYVVPRVYNKLPGSIFPTLPNVISQFVVFLVITVSISSLSWHLFELPINNLKKRFLYTTV